MTIKDVEEIEKLVNRLLPEPGMPSPGDYERWLARRHETILYYVKLPHGKEILEKKYKDHLWNLKRLKKGAETGELKYYNTKPIIL